MLKKIITILLSILFLILISFWLFSNDNHIVAKRKPVKKEIITSSYYFLGLKKTLTLFKQEFTYSIDGKILEAKSISNNKVTDRVVYHHTTFDSVQKIETYTGKEPVPYKFEMFCYDSLRRLLQKKSFEIRTKDNKKDTLLTNQTTYLYNERNFNYGSITDDFVENYLPPDYVKTFVKLSGRLIHTKKFNALGLVVSDTLRQTFDKSISNNTDLEIINYTYDARGFIKTKFSRDSVYYKTNRNGQITEEKEQYGNFVRTCNKNWYDKNGNKIKVFLDIDDGLTYKYAYDTNNRIIKEYPPSTWYSFIMRPIVIHNYEYFQ